MSRDIYSSLSGAMASWTQLETLANDLANAQTTGFKGGRVVFELAGPNSHPLGRAYAATTAVEDDLRDGAIVPDGISTHFALQGQGFFALEQADGAPLLTRDGRFSLDVDGRLVGAGGLPVLGQGGPIYVPEGETIRVDAEGIVYGSASGEIGQLRVVDGDVRRLGANTWSVEGELVPTDARVVQGSLEKSNVDPLVAMVSLVEASRSFEAFQKAMQASDELDERLNRSGGR